jgi:hypothetical protein
LVGLPAWCTGCGVALIKPGDLVQVRNTRIEKYPRYVGPMIVIRRTRGGAYILAEMDGTVLKEKVAAFRVLPHKVWKKITLPDNIHQLIDSTRNWTRTSVSSSWQEACYHYTSLVYEKKERELTLGFSTEDNMKAGTEQ